MDNQQIENQQKKSRTLPTRRIISIIIVVIVLAIMFFSGVSVKLGAESLKVSGTLSGSTEVQYENIKSVQLLDTFSVGSRTFGVDAIRVKCGTFSNSAYGKYKLYSYNGTQRWIEVVHQDGVLVFNEGSVEKTETIFKELSSHVK